MFSQEGCDYCRIQLDALKIFQDRYHWDIRVVDKAENPLMASRFNVNITPYTFIIERDTKEWMPVSVGAESLNQIEKGVYRALRLLNKEITPQQYFTTEENDGGFFDSGAIK
jgi:conjugal transfer pilus assembly protein TraF